MRNKMIKAIISRTKRLCYKFGGGKNNIHGINIIYKLQNVVISGCHNTIDVRSKLPKGVRIFVRGNNHKLIIEEGVIFKRGNIFFEDNDCEIYIGKGTTIEEADLSAAEDHTKLSIGDNCMFSKGIYISTTDSHSIISTSTGLRINSAKDVNIKSHVWLGRNVTINKGVTVSENSVVAGHSVVTKSTPPNCVAAGVPAKVVKTEVDWDRKRIQLISK